VAGARAPGGVAPVTGSAVSHGFADEIRAQRQEALYQLLLAFVLALAGTLAVYLGLSLAFDTPPLESCLGRVSDVGLPWAAAVMLSRGAILGGRDPSCLMGLLEQVNDFSPKEIILSTVELEAEIGRLFAEWGRVRS